MREARDRIRIRPIRTLDGLHECEGVQRAVWGFDEIEVVPSRLMAVIRHNGGMVLGAYEGRRLVGFAFSYPGFRDGRPIHCSHMLAVLPSHANRGIGFRLKQAQRNHLLHQGLDLMTWTFDPLESRNAHLNLHRLGATAGEFWVNLYGRTSSPLHHGLDTDRLVARWRLASERAVLCACGGAASPTLEEVLGGGGTGGGGGRWRVINRVRFRGGVPGSSEPDLRARGRRLALEIPRDAQALRIEHPRLARSWQLKVRRAFRSLFARGYRAVDFLSGRTRGGVGGGIPRSLYLLERRDED